MGSFKFRVRKFMKLFKSLLVAPATLGLLAPMSATANEVTINDFNAAEEIAVTNSRVDGLEARFNDLEAGSFSETTTASFSADKNEAKETKKVKCKRQKIKDSK